MIILRCPKHPRYKGMIDPRANCEECIALRRLRIAAEMNRLTVMNRPAELNRPAVK